MKIRCYGMAAALAALLGLVAAPSQASAAQEYYLGDAAGTWGWIYGYTSEHGARHSLTRISVRTSATASTICTYGADGNNMNVRNTAEYCIVSGTLAEATLGGILRYPWTTNKGPGLTNVRALSEW